MHEILSLSGVAQASLIRARKISSVELVGAHFAHIAECNPRVNAAIEILEEPALSAARAADERLASGAACGPFHGVPFSVKDSIESAGTICRAGTLGRQHADPSNHDATLVGRLREAGAILIARTNLPDLLFAFESDNLMFGPTRNPYDPQATSGGSSGGEAALHAICGSPFGLGSDAAGSVRIPAAFCGTASIKPTSGRLPRSGHFPPAGGWIEALWQIGPMARRVEDLPALLRVLAGSDGEDYTALDMPVDTGASLPAMRIAFFTDNGCVPADAEVSAVVRSCAGSLARHVASMTEDRPSCVEAAYDIEMKLIGADGGDGLRDYAASLGSHQVHPLLTGWLDKLEQYRTDARGLSAYWAHWDQFRTDMAAFAQRYDAVVCPAYIHDGLPLGTSTLDENFRGFSYTMAFNVAGWPAAVVRCGQSRAGRPIAVQIAAPPWREDVVLAIAQRLEEEFGGWKQPDWLTSGAAAS